VRRARTADDLADLVANAGVLVFAIGFYALLLSNVLFLTGVWGYGALAAGVALVPGPVMAALAAPNGIAQGFGRGGMADNRDRHGSSPDGRGHPTVRR
jgi:hypothetical protein